MHNTQVGKSKFIILSTRNRLFLYYFFALFICITTVRLLLPTPVYAVRELAFVSLNYYNII